MSFLEYNFNDISVQFYIATIVFLFSVAAFKFFGYFDFNKNTQILVDQKDFESAMKLVQINKKLREQFYSIQQPVAEMQEDVRDLCNRIDEISAQLCHILEEKSECDDEAEIKEVKEIVNNSVDNIDESDNESDSESEDESVGEIETPKNTIYTRNMKRAEFFENT